jgi:hypothetical protein
MDRHKLINILNKKIDDQKFLDLIQKLFNANTIKTETKNLNIKKEILEESILSPILCNIYLHKLDIEVKKIQKKYEKGKKKKLTKKFPHKTFKFKTKEFLRLPLEKRTKIITKTKKNIHNLKLNHINLNDQNFVRIRYVRYLNDILLGIAGSKKLLEIIKKRLTNFIKSNLNLKLIKTEIIHIASNKIDFLGMEINAIPHSTLFKKFEKLLEKKKKVKHKLALSKNIKEATLQKATQTVLKKTLREKNSLNIKNSFQLKKKIRAIKEKILLNEEFSKINIDTYREFIKSLIRSNLFVPTSLKKTLTTLENEIQQ